MLLLVTEQTIELNSNENVIVRTPAELCYIQPQGPALVIIDIKLPNAAILDWASKRTRATLWWLVGANLLVDIPFDAIPLQHCCVHQAHIGAAEFTQLLAPHYFGRFLGEHYDCLTFLDSGELEGQLQSYRQLALFPITHHPDQDEQWAQLFLMVSNKSDDTIEALELQSRQLKQTYRLEQINNLIRDVPLTDLVMVLR